MKMTFMKREVQLAVNDFFLFQVSKQYFDY